MLSVAEIPMLVGRFTGVIGVVKMGNREYRLATYLGATVQVDNQMAVVRQGRYTLTAQLLQACDHKLRAPVGGEMTRLIRESAACLAHYRFTRGDEVLLDFVSDQAGFEYEYDREKVVP